MASKVLEFHVCGQSVQATVLEVAGVATVSLSGLNIPCGSYLQEDEVLSLEEMFKEISALMTSLEIDSIR